MRVSSWRRRLRPAGPGAARAVLAALAALCLAGAAPPGKPPPLLEEVFGGPFALTDHNGRAVTETTFRGRFMLVYFGYTFCPDLCPTNLLTMAAALEALAPEDAGRVQPLFVTVDPERDSLPALKEYMAHFGPRFLALRGAARETRAVLKAWRVHRRKVLPRGEAAGGDYLVDHATLTFLMGPDGRFRTLFPHDTPADRMTATVARYLAAEP